MASTKKRREEQEDASTEVTEVASNVLRMQLPIRMPGLGHVNCYALLDDDGAAVVDPGLPGPSTWRAMVNRLKQVGLEPRNVHSVIVTHSHPDHFGGVARMAKESGARVIAHRAFSFGARSPAAAEPEVSVEDLDAHQALHAARADASGSTEADQNVAEAMAEATSRGRTPWGGEHPHPGVMVRLKWTAMRMLGGRIIPEISHPVENGDVLRLAGREWFVVHTPGHTPDHFCLHDPEQGVFIAGDHVLPTITPHISGIGSSRDPLASFFYSLDRVAEITGVEQVLPAHGHPFRDLPARTEAIKRHHEERLASVKTISREIGPACVEAFTQRLFKRRSWGPMADSETYAHLEHLRIAGQAERTLEKDGSFLYEAG
ncbi:MAG: MBL fold metallo-hydrolase [Myxococcales bacterium]|nr:MBL fold metallo-hydrolase [Myxococcales bacterium]